MKKYLAEIIGTFSLVFCGTGAIIVNEQSNGALCLVMKTVMNTKFLTLISLFFLATLNAQTHRFIYEYKFVPDSTKIDSVITENVRLEIYRDHSEFVSDLNAKRDSAILKSAEKNTGEVGLIYQRGNSAIKFGKVKTKSIQLNLLELKLSKS